MNVEFANDVDLSEWEKMTPESQYASDDDIMKGIHAYARWLNTHWMYKTRFFNQDKDSTLR